MCLAAISHVHARERESELTGGVRSNQPCNRRWNKWDCPRRLKQQHVRSGPVITEAAGLTSCSVSAGYCFPPRRGSALIASLMSSGSLFISGCILSLARPAHLCLRRRRWRRLLPLCVARVLKSSPGLGVHIHFMAGFVAYLNPAVLKRICRTCGLLRRPTVHLPPPPPLSPQPPSQSAYLTHTDSRVLCHLVCFHSVQRSL